MPSIISRFAIATGFFVFAAASSALSAETLVTFDDQKVNAAPKGLTCVLAGRGKPGIWKVKTDGGNKALAQLGKHDRNGRYPVCVVDGLSTKDVDLSVRFKPDRGRYCFDGRLNTAPAGHTTHQSRCSSDTWIRNL